MRRVPALCRDYSWGAHSTAVPSMFCCVFRARSAAGVLVGVRGVAGAAKQPERARPAPPPVEFSVGRSRTSVYTMCGAYAYTDSSAATVSPDEAKTYWIRVAGREAALGVGELYSHPVLRVETAQAMRASELCVTSCESPVEYRIESVHLAVLARDLSAMMQLIPGDVDIVSGSGERIAAHWVMLRARCPYFSAMHEWGAACAGAKAAELVRFPFSSAAIRAVLRWVYCADSACCLDADVAAECAELADMLLLQDLAGECAQCAVAALASERDPEEVVRRLAHEDCGAIGRACAECVGMMESAARSGGGDGAAAELRGCQWAAVPPDSVVVPLYPAPEQHPPHRRSSLKYIVFM
eukprot:m51a1_g681 hypothetical protein (354) ;mRNA; r:311164-312607